MYVTRLACKSWSEKTFTINLRKANPVWCKTLRLDIAFFLLIALKLFLFCNIGLHAKFLYFIHTFESSRPWICLIKCMNVLLLMKWWYIDKLEMISYLFIATNFNFTYRIFSFSVLRLEQYDEKELLWQIFLPFGSLVMIKLTFPSVNYLNLTMLVLSLCVWIVFAFTIICNILLVCLVSVCLSKSNTCDINMN